MTRQLVLVHGRAQEHLEAKALKSEWLAALEEGLAKSNLKLATADTDVRFPYYGDALFDLAGGKSQDEAASVILRGEGADDDERRFLNAVLEEVRRKNVGKEHGHKQEAHEKNKRWYLRLVQGRNVGRAERAYVR